ncbi:unnamed protein product [Sphacelaria rigidula]
MAATIDRTDIEKIAQQPLALSLGDPLSPSETKEVLRAMSNGKATDPDGLPAEILKLGQNGEASKIPYHFHSIVSAIWTSGEVPREWKDHYQSTAQKKDRTECVNYKSVSLAAHATGRPGSSVANRLGNFCAETDIFPE